MKYISMKWLWCYVAMLTIGITDAQWFIRGLVAGIGVTALPIVIRVKKDVDLDRQVDHLDYALKWNQIVLLGSGADFYMRRHPASAGVAVGAVTIITSLALIEKSQRKRRIAEKEKRRAKKDQGVWY
jgi:hypothetical protein